MKMLKLLLFFGLCQLVAGSQFREAPIDESTIEQQLGSDPLAKEFVKGTPHLSVDATQKLETDLLKESQQREEAVAAEAGKCIIDWAAPCPKLWKVKDRVETSEIFCIAPKSYIGLCRTSISFALYTPEAKEDWAQTCQVEWPCKENLKESCPSGKRDFTLPCPEGFDLQDEETCAPDLSQYQGPCQGQSNFSSFSEDAKKSWSETCGAVWPCWEECTNEYEALCPAGWTHKGNYECIAPKYYGGPCAKDWNFKFYTPGMKETFEEKCKARFPCENTCDKNYALQCPNGWEPIDGSCKPPASYSSCALPSLPFKDLSVGEKMSFEIECGIDWACKDNDICERDWTLPCPEAWQNIPPPGSDLAEMASNHRLTGISCAPPVDYSGKCKNNEEFKSEEEKRKWASNCDHPWPCKKIVEGKTLESILLHPSTTVTGISREAMRKRPRSPYAVVDTREVGKRGPVHHETGEIMPRIQKKTPGVEEIFGEELSARVSSPLHTTAALQAKIGKFGLGSQVPFMNQVKPIMENPYNPGPKGFYSDGHFLTGSQY